MKFTFIGNGDNDPDFTTLMGIKFPLGQAVEVTDEQAIAKLKWNNHFKEGDADPTKKKPGRPPKVSKPLKIEQVELGDDD